MNSIHFDFLPENHFWLQGTNKEDFYLYFELRGIEAPESATRIPLNLSLVIDRSGSMQGEKIEFAKKAANFVVNNLGERDTVSVVQYDNEVDIVSPAGNVKNKTSLFSKIESITARNMTNLSAGMISGYSQLEIKKVPGVVNRVLLLSDGLANEGVTDPALLQRMVQEKFRNEGLAISTFGVGADFDEKLMTSLSEYGGGNYYFIDSPDKIPSIFAKELEGLLAVVAQNTILELEFPEGFSCKEILGYSGTYSNNSAQVHFNDVFSNERKAILIKFRAEQAPTTDFHFSAKLSYYNPTESFKNVAEQRVVRIGITQDKQQLEGSVETKVAEQTTLFTASQLLEKVATYNELKDYNKAWNTIISAKQLVDFQLLALPGSEELSLLLEKIKQLLAAQKDIENMQKVERLKLSKALRYASYGSQKKR